MFAQQRESGNIREVIEMGWTQGKPHRPDWIEPGRITGRVLCISVVVAQLSAACMSSHLSSQQLVRANLEAMHEAIASRVPDAQRATRINQAIDRLDAELLSFEAILQTFHSRAEALNARPNTTRAEFEALLEQFETQRIATRTRVAQLHFDMIAATTSEEWKELARYERAALTASEH
jgi:hypothetical protein